MEKYYIYPSNFFVEYSTCLGFAEVSLDLNLAYIYSENRNTFLVGPSFEALGKYILYTKCHQKQQSLLYSSSFNPIICSL